MKGNKELVVSGQPEVGGSDVSISIRKSEEAYLAVIREGDILTSAWRGRYIKNSVLAKMYLACFNTKIDHEMKLQH